MIRGTTPTHIFNLPFDTSSLKEVRITYEQDGAKVLEKTEADCTLEGSAITVQLTQEETLAFNENKNVSYQLKLLTTDNEVLATRIKQIRVDRVLCEEVLE